MENLTSIWHVDYVIFEVLGYALSFLELIGTVAGLISVYFATKANILTWPIGIINVMLFAILFYQVQLYSDALLQVYFFVMSIYGWINWSHSGSKTIVPRKLSVKWIYFYLFILVFGTIVLGSAMTHVHLWFPSVFAHKAAFPLPDAFTTVASILATILLARKLIESWYLWIIVDIISISLYFLKDIRFVAIEYIVLLILATVGFVSWRKKLMYA